MGDCKIDQKIGNKMIKLIPKIFFYKLSRTFGFAKMLPMNYTVSVCYSCNSHCKTCNIYKKKADNLNLSEYEEIFRKIGKSPYWITISGGEPFLREDLAEICQIIYKHSKPKIINIPSNGLMTKTIVNVVQKIAESCPQSQIIINLSVDEIGKKHDEIRGVPGNYKNVMRTFERLKKIPQQNLSVGIHTVISKFNVKNLSQISNTLMNLNPDSYITEIAEERIELDTIGADITPDQFAYSSAIDLLIHRIKYGKFKGMHKITQAFRIEYYNFVKKILRDKKQIIPCYAGIASAQISPDGDIWSCCIKAESMGNLRKNDYNFKKIWFNKKMKDERKSIKNKECYCPLANAGYTNMLMDFPTLFRVSFRSFIKWWS